MPNHFHLLIKPDCLDEIATDGIKPSANRGWNNSTDGIKPSANRWNDDLPPTWLGDGFTPSLIEDIVHDIKGKTAMDIKKYLDIKGKIWQKSFYDYPVYSEKKFQEKLNYIHNNPLKARLVKDPKDYPWSSYQNYYLNNHLLIKIDYPEL